MLPWEMLPPLLLILTLGIFVQASAGFAAGLLTIPLLLWTGYGIPEAQAALLVATIPQNMSGVWAFRAHVVPREIVFPASLRLLALPLGAYLLIRLETLPKSQIHQVVGAVVFVVTLVIIVMRPQPRHTLPVGWAWLAFLSSGFLQGLVGMGGPMMVLWIQAHDWDTKKTRAFLFAMYLVSMLPALLILWLLFGNRILAAGASTLLLVPWLLAVTWAGLHVGTWLGRARLRTLTLGLLLLIGLAGVCGPMLRAPMNVTDDRQTTGTPVSP